MNKIPLKGLLLKIFIPTSVFSAVYLIFGYFCTIPHLLLFCILGTLILVPAELGMILFAGKKEYGAYSLKSALAGHEKASIPQALIIALIFFGIAGLLSAFAAPIENSILASLRAAVLNALPQGFDWADFEHLRTFSAPTLVFLSVYYCFFNALLAPITEELFFRGYLTSHYTKQNNFTPILIAVLFSLYHFWLPFSNIFRILAFAPVAYVAYKKKNLLISILFHCFCNLFSVITFLLALWS